MLKVVSWLLIILGLALLIFIFGPAIKEEIRYNFDQMARVKYVIGTEQLGTFEKPIRPVNTDFSILIPKIGAVAPIIDGVDATDPKQYLPAIKKGVAHAAGSGIPDEDGNVYLFAHSADTFWHVGSYNVRFFLIDKLITGDEIDIFYKGRLIKYTVFDKKVMETKATKFTNSLDPDLNPSSHTKTLTIQTGYPAGTSLKRLIVIAKEETP